MNPEPANQDPMNRARAWLGFLRRHFGAILAAATGIVLLQPVGDDLARWSYDLPFLSRRSSRVEEAVIIYLDNDSHRDLNQPYNAPWDRALHARLLDKLKAAGARAVVFDIIFAEANTNAPASDEALARAIADNGRVILAAEWSQIKPSDEVEIKIAPLQALMPHEPFVSAAAGWGHAKLPYDPDAVVRAFPANERAVSGFDFFPSLAWAAAKFAGSPTVRKPGGEHAPRWMSYYGPPGIIAAYPYSVNFLPDVPDSILEDYYKDKVVFIGAQLSADFSGKGKDEFATPYSKWTRRFSPGVEIQATAFLNLLRGDWLTRVPELLELVLVIFVGAFSSVALQRTISRRRVAELLALGLVVGVTVAAHLLVWKFNVWFAWLIVAIQVVVAYLWALVRHAWALGIQKGILQRSLTLHLSPARVEQLLKEPELLKPGGRQQEVSVLFTDIADFSKLAQRKTPEDLFKMLNGYYAAALKGVHQTDGTVVQLIGDAIFAVWNAPLPHPDHRVRACRAAIELHAHLADFEPRQAGRPQFVTRAGVHTGPAVVGNLGSQDRFEFTAIGETVNLASRLEGLNKHLGTSILATRAIQSAVEEELTCRAVGLFQFKGFGNVVEVYELMGRTDIAETTRPWRAVFDEGLHLFRPASSTPPRRSFAKPSSLAGAPTSPPRCSARSRRRTGRHSFTSNASRSFASSRRRKTGAAKS
ncbi:MAG: adenylate/guanylate cyclase domain-containing protein [Verrucomicrobia bacterium]|nr:adenylate/guanylate cyclase domain-containing protein [Verrucomicrobiota bacterium]